MSYYNEFEGGKASKLDRIPKRNPQLTYPDELTKVDNYAYNKFINRLGERAIQLGQEKPYNLNSNALNTNNLRDISDYQKFINGSTVQYYTPQENPQLTSAYYIGQEAKGARANKEIRKLASAGVYLEQGNEEAAKIILGREFLPHEQERYEKGEREKGQLVRFREKDVNRLTDYLDKKFAQGTPVTITKEANGDTLVESLTEEQKYNLEDTSEYSYENQNFPNIYGESRAISPISETVFPSTTQVPTTSQYPSREQTLMGYLSDRSINVNSYNVHSRLPHLEKSELKKIIELTGGQYRSKDNKSSLVYIAEKNLKSYSLPEPSSSTHMPIYEAKSEESTSTFPQTGHYQYKGKGIRGIKRLDRARLGEKKSTNKLPSEAREKYHFSRKKKGNRIKNRHHGTYGLGLMSISDAKEQLKILTGEIDAGNDSKELKNELSDLISGMVKKHIIPKSKSINLIKRYILKV